MQRLLVGRQNTSHRSIIPVLGYLSKPPRTNRWLRNTLLPGWGEAVTYVRYSAEELATVNKPEIDISALLGVQRNTAQREKAVGQKHNARAVQTAYDNAAPPGC